MGEQQHTPGPWKAWFRCRNQRTLIGDWNFVGPDGSSPVKLGGTVECNVGARANARLIAAAPDMLEALRGLLADCEEYARINNLHNADGSPATHHSMRQAREAIAKATEADHA